MDRQRENKGEGANREVLLRFAKNADRGVIIYICEAASGPRATRRHVDARAAALPCADDDMNLIYKL